MAAVRTELASIDRPVVIGGRSMGGRICSMVAAGADGLEPPPQVDGVVLISYPLHPPGRPDSLRVEHLPQLRVPCLVIQGERDTFGTPDELAPWMATVPGGVTTVVIEGGRHELRGADAAIAEHVAAWVRDLAHG
jgi:predicted alpha/beta-hydrolase family hydrolase